MPGSSDGQWSGIAFHEDFKNTDMKNLYLMLFVMLTGLSTWAAFAGPGHGHGGNTEKSKSVTMHRGHGHSKEGAHHRHKNWVDPPKAYADKVSDVWVDADAIERGEEIYKKLCVSCHGVDGQGTGPMAQLLSHPPADLTNNFHSSPGDGDAYLFWRISEGGMVEPFKSQGSKMPAFKEALSESERWDVLSYVHTFFHQGLMEWQQSGVEGDNRRSKKSGS